MVEIKDLTIICADTKNYGRAVYALKKCMEQVKAVRVLFLTDIDLEIEGVEVVKIESIHSVQQYSRFIIKELYKFFETSHCLIIQWDGYILNGDCWENEFLTVDYIGAPWNETDGFAVANGGFSIRSKRLMKSVALDEAIISTHPEDNQICKVYRPYLEAKYGFKWASVELADKFSFELKKPVQRTFGFHGWFHSEFKPVVIIKRSAALGDCVAVEPVLYYFTKKKYMVVLDTLPQFKELYRQHFYKVHFLDEIDQRLVPGAKKYDLDFSYESKPEQLHLKTYFEFCEVPESEMILRNPILTLSIPIEPATKLFKKYCVLHIPDRRQNPRNIQGDIDWPGVVKYLKGEGYDTIQIGGANEVEGALQMMTPGEPFLMWVIRSADLFLGIDSGPSNIAVAMEVPAVIFFGSVTPSYIYADLSKIETVEIHNVCDTPKCWSRSIGCEGTECYISEESPPCVQFTTEQVYSAIDKIFLR
jgi:ADP-heptose:LPS heptosyltransferase